MSTHPDAIGFLYELAEEINEPWFKVVCDLVAVLGVSMLDEQTISELYAYYNKKASYIGTQPAATPIIAIPTSTRDFLEKLTNFTNFKLLGNSLELNLNKRITVIFGANGSGKSSLCESIKVLANPGQPIRPLQNVRPYANHSISQFHYKFKSDNLIQSWSKASGFGSRQATVKYFDTSLAIQILKNEMQPGRVVALSPFKLHVFEHVKVITAKFRESLQKAQVENSNNLVSAISEISRDFSKFKESPLALLTIQNLAALPAQIRLGENFTNETNLVSKIAQGVYLEKATSEDGLKLLRAEHRELDLIVRTLNNLTSAAAEMWASEPVKKAQQLTKKQLAQAELASAIIPEKENLSNLMPLLRAAHAICKLDEPADNTCPLCKQTLEVKATELFKRYHEILVSQLEAEIVALKTGLAESVRLGDLVVKIARESWDQFAAIHFEVLTRIKEQAQLISDNCDVNIEPSDEARAAYVTLKTQVAQLAAQTEAKKVAIELADKGRDGLLRQLVDIRKEIEPLEYAQAVKTRLHLLKVAERRAGNAAVWNERLPAFTLLLKKITDKAKYAYEKLVLPDFEARLNDEYVALAEKTMADFGVVLARKGLDATVNLLPKIGGNQIEGVLSEGEQRLHALALYFAELKTCPQSVLVFDDPISSFDYNYVTNYCRRLRDFSLSQPERQIIILTHSWEFFVQIQTTLNKAQLESHISVLVLENCSSVANYSEKIDELKTDISAILSANSEPSTALKEEAAGKMRRLMEAVVNTHVFANQRHQFKQKTQQISAYTSFTKVVALLPAEAHIFGDLYGKLSVTEHDDPRNAYVNADKSVFQTRYNQIIAIEAAIIARRP